ncbi:MAG: DUF2807 domain-containing protein [Bacteroidaceae bacterium]|nr:DUF2807 domain-containing protein [Bacteroidaceae bacterium]
MKTFKTLAITIMSFFTLSSCSFHIGNTKGEGEIITRDIETQPFKEVSVAGNIHVIFRQSTGNRRVTFMARENLIDMVEATVDDSTLRIKVKEEYVTVPDTFTVMIQAPVITQAAVAGSGMFEAKSDIVAPSFKCNVTGSGNIALMKVTTGETSIGVSGSGKILTEDFDCESLYSVVSGSGDIRLHTVTVNNMDSKIAGSGVIQIHNIKAESCRARITGSGDMSFDGTATYVDFNITGSGDIKASELQAKNGKAHTTGSGDIVCNVKENFETTKTGSGNIRNIRRGKD